MLQGKIWKLLKLFQALLTRWLSVEKKSSPVKNKGPGVVQRYLSCRLSEGKETAKKGLERGWEIETKLSSLWWDSGEPETPNCMQWCICGEFKRQSLAFIRTWQVFPISKRLTTTQWSKAASPQIFVLPLSCDKLGILLLLR